MNSIEICKTRFEIKNINYLTRREPALVKLLSKGLTVKPNLHDEIKSAKLVEYGIELNHAVSVYAGDGEIITETQSK